MAVRIEIIVRDTSHPADPQITGWRTWELNGDIDADEFTQTLFADLDEIGVSQ